ncbi:hypothetical protein [Comamonas aquatica]|uniref:hypothetical protein n=1 Tax=Comamonas aquatica TaxID=225991 RepID=UPI002447F659|nr:hypothetical protein [Comamonas aquatica]MDH0493340.1 hypothetical protein [Comamonas aquatica]
MKETGLMFKAPLVRAILEGRKTQTRRIVKPQPVAGQGMVNAGYCGDRHLWLRDGPCDKTDPAYEWRCPMGKPGDRIYVRETWANGIHALAAEREEDGPFVYAADGDLAVQGRLGERWKPAIHMPKYAARIWLEITAVRVERLQDISEDDADAEGCERLETERYERDWKLCPKCGGTRLHDALGAGLGVIHDVDCRECDTYVKRFRHLWLSTGGDWDANPWVWVIDFKTISTNGHPA